VKYYAGKNVWMMATIYMENLNALDVSVLCKVDLIRLGTENANLLSYVSVDNELAMWLFEHWWAV
jgi:hypothetical protein